MKTGEPHTEAGAHASNGNGHASENIALEILMLASRSEVEYQQIRKQKAKELGLGVCALDALVKAERKRIKADGERAKHQQRQNSSDWCYWPDVTNEGKAKARSQTNIEYFLKREGIELSFDMMAHRAIVTRNGETGTLTDPLGKSLWLEGVWTRKCSLRTVRPNDDATHAASSDGLVRSGRSAPSAGAASSAQI